ncbi:RTA1 like protein [Lophium mytilinum]|uniref:RTA1 like protein n=1 Tax=Lophium mytilinum TaxID=390894 RepID=A0A6A6QFY0_9PEZI|nr:RTA1 like protein [Lophium mytilinum]
MAKDNDATNDSIWLYTPSTALAIVVATLYLIPTSLLFYQTILKYRSWFFLCVLIGSCLEVGGYIARAVSTKQVTEIPPFAASSTLIILAPIFVAAGNYLLIGRLIRVVLPPPSASATATASTSSAKRIFGLRAQHITRIFVGCDVLSCLIQASGSGIASSGNWTGNSAKVGTDVLIAGLSTQVGTFVWFLAIVWRFSVLTKRGGLVVDGAPEGWLKVLWAIYASSALILVRCVYRVIEFALGIDGYPFTHEWVFYVFESLPMLPAISVFCVYHPARYLGKAGWLQKQVSEEPGVELLPA